MQITSANGDFAARFIEAIEEQSHGIDHRILLAVSGGPDSLALMLLAHTDMADRIAVATVDHGLRPEARAEASFVAGLCAERGIAHQILHPAEPISGNIQSSARTVRYALLEQAADQLDCALIATAHHRDDQLETLLMRLARGSGVDGMSGIRPRNGRIIRPLLKFCKSELEEICSNAGIVPAHDPSNENAEFDRVAMRQWLASAAHPFDTVRAARTAASMHDASIALQWMAEQLSNARISQNKTEIQCDANNLPHDLQRRMALICLAKLDPDLRPRGDTVERLVAELNEDGTTTVGNILCSGGPIWRFSAAPPRRVDI